MVLPSLLSSFDSVVSKIVQPCLSPRLHFVAKIVKEIAIRAIFPIAAVFMIASMVPASISGIVIGITAVGTSFLSAFFFKKSWGGEETKKEIPKPIPVTVAPIAPPIPRPLSQLPEGAPIGIINARGNDCWAISNFFKLFAAKDTREWLATPLLPIAEGATEEEKRFREIFTIYQEQLRIYTADMTARWAVSDVSSQELCKVLHSEVAQKATQEDAPEGLPPLLNQFENGYIRFHMETKYNTQLAEGRNIPLHGAEAFPVNEAGDARIQAEKSQILELPIVGPTFQDCLNGYLREPVEDETGTELRGTDGNIHRYKKISIERKPENAPEVLRFSFKRYQYIPPKMSKWSHVPFLRCCCPRPRGEIRKITHPVNIPLTLDWGTKDGQSHSYQLLTFDVHTGTSTRNGHYLTYSKVNNQWYEQNCSKIALKAEEEIRQILNGPNVYQFWYEKTP